MADICVAIAPHKALRAVPVCLKSTPGMRALDSLSKGGVWSAALSSIRWLRVAALLSLPGRWTCSPVTYGLSATLGLCLNAITPGLCANSATAAAYYCAAASALGTLARFQTQDGSSWGPCMVPTPTHLGALFRRQRTP